MPARATSSGMVTCRSTSSADAPGNWAIDLDDGRRGVGIGFDVDVQEGPNPITARTDGEQDDDERVSTAQCDELANHGNLPENPGSASSR